jgi:hypothetical protein
VEDGGARKAGFGGRQGGRWRCTAAGGAPQAGLSWGLHRALSASAFAVCQAAAGCSQALTHEWRAAKAPGWALRNSGDRVPPTSAQVEKPRPMNLHTGGSSSGSGEGVWVGGRECGYVERSQEGERWAGASRRCVALGRGGACSRAGNGNSHTLRGNGVAGPASTHTPMAAPTGQHPHARGDAHQYQLGQGQSRLVHSCGHGILVNLGWRQHGRHRLHRQVGGGGSGGTSVERSRVGVCCGIGLAGLAGQLGLRPRQWGCRPCLDAVLWLQPRERQGQWQQAAARGRGWAG